MLLVALALDLAVGWPDALFRRIGHPVTWLGAAIDRLERAMNLPEARPGRRAGAGAMASLAVILIAAVPFALAQAWLPASPLGVAIGGILAWPWLAASSLHAHVAAVARPLAAQDLTEARRAVAKIVGRDPDRLDAAGVARAGLESLAENASDGVAAPIFWGVLLGLPGLAAYKAVNTLDSMIGHKTPRFRAFGRFAARLDDALNWVPARLTGAGFALVSGRGAAPWRVMLRDARRHRSPNAGWPEAAMAGSLAVRLSGPRDYGATRSDEPWLNATAPDPGAAQIARGLVLYRRFVALLALLLAAAALAAWGGD